MTRREARILAMQAIFQMERQNEYNVASVRGLLEERDINSKQREYIDSCLRTFLENREYVDSLISGASKRWSISRLARADLAILRLAVTEMKLIEDVPEAAAVSEAVELAKIYSTEKSPSYVNGVLGRISRS